jgi:hypothetical protein
VVVIMATSMESVGKGARGALATVCSQRFACVVNCTSVKARSRDRSFPWSWPVVLGTLPESLAERVRRQPGVADATPIAVAPGDLPVRVRIMRRYLVRWSDEHRSIHYPSDGTRIVGDEDLGGAGPALP